MDVKQMFDDIAPRYDALNHILSLGIDRGWRARVVRMVEGRDILDVATGTGDLAIAMARAMPRARVTGVDISEGMLEIAREKIRRRSLVAAPRLVRDDSSALAQLAAVRRRVGAAVDLRVASAEELPFGDGEFDCVTAAFGVRNFGDRQRGLGEMCRVLRAGGVCLILEFSEPRGAIFGRIYRWYFHRILPLVGRLISRSEGAYAYLPRSVGDFPTPEKFSGMMLSAGFSSVERRKLTGGVAFIYKCVK